MIRYALVCDAGHAFDGWFRSSADFDAQAARDLVTCVECGSAKVTKALMTPAVTGTKKSKVSEPSDATEGTAAAPALPVPAVPLPVPTPVIAPDPRQLALVALMRHIRETVEKTAENVGDTFAEEARAIHEGEAEARGIYGQATPDEVRDLIEDGIEVFPVPVLPEDRN